IVGLAFFAILIFGAVFVLMRFSTELTLLERLEATSSEDREEPRTAIWMKTIELISQNWLGYGANSYRQLMGSYPHNVFLETFLSFGVFGFAIMLSIALIFVYSLIKSIKEG